MFALDYPYSYHFLLFSLTKRLNWRITVQCFVVLVIPTTPKFSFIISPTKPTVEGPPLNLPFQRQ